MWQRNQPNKFVVQKTTQGSKCVTPNMARSFYDQSGESEVTVKTSSRAGRRLRNFPEKDALASQNFNVSS